MRQGGRCADQMRMVVRETFWGALGMSDFFEVAEMRKGLRVMTAEEFVAHVQAHPADFGAPLPPSLKAAPPAGYRVESALPGTMHRTQL